MTGIDALAGNSALKEKVNAMISSDRMPQLVLIEGQKGSGRHTLAKILASAAACTGEPHPCGRCAACRSENNPDVEIIEPQAGKNYLIDDIRAMRDRAYILPNHSRRRVFVISQASALNERCQNSLLKVIEEPPETVMFIIICEFAQQLIATVRSRATLLTLMLPDAEQAARYILDRGDYDAELVRRTVLETAGNIGAALQRLDGDTGVYSDAQTAAQKLLGPELDLLAFLKRYEKNRADTKKMILALGDILHAALSIKMGTASPYDKDDIRFTLARELSARQLYDLSDICISRAAMCDVNPNQVLFLTNLCASLKQAINQ